MYKVKINTGYLYLPNDDSRVFRNELDCISYERSKRGDNIKLSQFFTNYGTKVTKDDSFISYIFIHPNEYEDVKEFLKGRNRSIMEKSETNLYYSCNMIFYPIEHYFEKIEKRRNEIDKEELRLNDIVHSIKKQLNK